MKTAAQMANRFREILLDGDWVVNTNYKAQLSDLTWQQSTTKIGTCNTIADLTFHINYYISGVINVFKGGSLDIRDKYSFDAPPIKSQKDWELRLEKMWTDADDFALLVENMSDEQLNDVFVDKKYGTYHRNIDCMIEHSYYHLGQIVLIKKMLP